MNPNKKVANEPVATATEKIDALESVAALYIKGVEGFAEMQKKSIDLASQQNAEIVDIWKKNMQAFPFAQGLVMLDLAAATFERYADTQKGAIDLMVEQSHKVAGLVRERTEGATKATQGAVTMVQEMVDYSVASQKKVLDSSVAQTRAAIDTINQHFGLAGIPVERVTGSIQRGLDSFVETQKELLHIAAKPISLVH
jgi:hypothetical protein